MTVMGDSPALGGHDGEDDDDDSRGSYLAEVDKVRRFSEINKCEENFLMTEQMLSLSPWVAKAENNRKRNQQDGSAREEAKLEVSLTQLLT